MQMYAHWIAHGSRLEESLPLGLLDFKKQKRLRSLRRHYHYVAVDIQ